jgi:hypothetical protein
LPIDISASALTFSSNPNISKGTPQLSFSGSGDAYINNNINSSDLIFRMGAGQTEAMRLTSGGGLLIRAGTATASTAPLKFTLAGAALNTTPERGAEEAAKNARFFTDSLGTRHRYIASGDTTDNGFVQTTAFTFVTGSVDSFGVDNTADTIFTKTFPAVNGRMHELGDRIRVRAYYQATSGAPIVGSLRLNGVLIADLSVSTDALAVNEAWLHYIDNTHANIIEQHPGDLGALSAVNVAGFDWDSNQTVIFTQDMVSGNHLVVYMVAIDFFPKGTL